MLLKAILTFLLCCLWFIVAIISEVFTIEQLKEKQEKNSLSSSYETDGSSGTFLNQFTGIVYVYLTYLDTDSRTAICNRWLVATVQEERFCY